MAFPISPTNGQTATVNGITYSYSSSDNAWTRVTSNNIVVTGNVTTGNLISTTAFINGNLPATSNATGTVIVVGGVGVRGNVFADAIYDGGVEVLAQANAAFAAANNALDSAVALAIALG